LGFARELLEEMVAKRATVFALNADARIHFNPAKARVALGADGVVSFHARSLPRQLRSIQPSDLRIRLKDRGEDQHREPIPVPCQTSIKGHADALFLAPHEVTRPAQPIAGDAQGKPVGKPQGAVDFERRARLGDVADRARDRVAAELDRSGFQDAVTGCDTML